MWSRLTLSLCLAELLFGPAHAGEQTSEGLPRHIGGFFCERKKKKHTSGRAAGWKLGLGLRAPSDVGDFDHLASEDGVEVSR